MRSIVRPVIRDMGSAIGVPFGGGVNWGSYFKKNCSFYAYKREGTELIDYFGNNAQILFPVFSTTSSKTNYAYIQDNGALDIGSNDFTFGMWVNVLDNAPLTAYYLGGKCIQALVGGKYGFTVQSNKKFLAHFVSTGGTISLYSDNIAQTDTWYFLLLEIDQTNHKTRFYINNVLQGSELSWSGTFPSVDNKYYFYIGSGNSSTGGGGVALTSYAKFSEIGLYNRLLTTEEKTSWYNGTSIPENPKAYWMINNPGASREIDISGNGYHLNYGSLDNSMQCCNFDSFGSSNLLDTNFIIYKSSTHIIKIYCPEKDLKGNDLTLTDFEEYPEGVHITSLDFLNLPNCAILFSGDEWDRSNTSLYENEARSSTTYYDSSRPKLWHVDELNNLMFQVWAKDGHKGRNFVKITDNSYKSRKLLKYICTFNEDKYNSSEWNKLMAYVGDYKVTADSYLENEFVFWKYIPVTDEYILTQRGSKKLKWIDSTTDKFALSVDCGETYLYEINSPFNGQKPCFAYIYDNGNILIASYDGIIRVSTDNLQSWQTPTVLDINGNPFVVTTNCFQPMLFATVEEVNNEDINLMIWGCYSNNSGTAYYNINIFYTLDRGLTIKSCYKAGVTNPPNLPARHMHALKYREEEDAFWMATGDSSLTQAEINWIKGVYDWENDTWSWSYIIGDPVGSTTDYKTVGFMFDEINGYVYFAGDSTNGTTSRGLLKCPISSISKNNFVKVLDFNGHTSGFINEGDIIIYGANIEMYQIYNKLIIGKDGFDSKYFTTYLYGSNNTLFMCHDSTRKDDNGYFLIRCYSAGYTTRIIDFPSMYLKIKE